VDACDCEEEEEPGRAWRGRWRPAVNHAWWRAQMTGGAPTGRFFVDVIRLGGELWV